MAKLPPIRAAQPGENIFILTLTPKGLTVPNSGQAISVRDDIVLHNVVTQAGHSGAPVFAEQDGAFLGLHIGTDDKAKPEFNYFVPTLLLKEETGRLKAQ